MRFGQQPQPRWVERELAFIGRGGQPLGLDEVAEIQVVEPAKLSAQRALLTIELQLARTVAQANEGPRAEGTKEQNAARDAEGGGLRHHLRLVVFAAFQ